MLKEKAVKKMIIIKKIVVLKVEETNIPLKDIRLKLDKYKELNILYDDLLNHVWRMIYGKNRVNNEIDNIDCNIVEDAKRYLTNYIKIVSDKQALIYSLSELTDELMEGLDVNTSNDIAIKEIKDLKRVALESTDKFNSYIKLETKEKNIEKKILKKKDIEKKGIKKKGTTKEHIKEVNAKKNSVEHDANNKPAASADIKARMIDKQKLIKKDIRVY